MTTSGSLLLLSFLLIIYNGKYTIQVHIKHTYKKEFKLRYKAHTQTHTNRLPARKNIFVY